MKKFVLLLFLAGFIPFAALSAGIQEYLRESPMVAEIRPMVPNGFFTEAYQIRVRQPIDHKDPAKGTFLQRVFISIREPGAPVILVTEGYRADYGANPAYINELCPILNASLVVAEHRYFGPSAPETPDWQYLTVENAAGDHHNITALLKPLLGGPWIGTGISKGGQTALLHRVFYPEDTDITVAYVAPFNFGVEDGRHEPYIARVAGTPAGRRKVKAFQREVLKRKSLLMPLFEAHVQDKGYTFNAPYGEIFDFCVLEYSFSFWQWGNDPAQIPSAGASDSEIFNHFTRLSSPSYFSLEELERIGSFFIQAAMELGYYGYDTRPFRRHLTVKNASGYLNKLFLPAGVNLEFDGRSVETTRNFLNSTDARMIFIYGGDDPWTASGVDLPRKENFLKIVQPGASHTIRIAGLDSLSKDQVMQRLTQWIISLSPAVAN
jgi:hypothetical protein